MKQVSTINLTAERTDHSWMPTVSLEVSGSRFDLLVALAAGVNVVIDNSDWTISDFLRLCKQERQDRVSASGELVT